MLTDQQIERYDRDTKKEEDILFGLIFGLWSTYANKVVNVEEFNIKQYDKDRKEFLNSYPKQAYDDVLNINHRMENITKTTFPFLRGNANLEPITDLGYTYVSNALIFCVLTLDNTIKTIHYMDVPPDKAQQMVEYALDGAEDKINIASSNSVLKARSLICDDLMDQNNIDMYRVRTMMDNKVRKAHQEQEGKLYSQHDPDRFEPGEDPNCRCIKEPFNF